jgi:hypothetical protein
MVFSLPNKERPLSPIVYKCKVDFPKKLAQDASEALAIRNEPEEGKDRGQEREEIFE